MRHRLTFLIVLLSYLHSSWGKSVPAGDSREERDLVYQNMIMRNKFNWTTRDRERIPFVGGGILERKVNDANNGTESRHEESREMECCSTVTVSGGPSPHMESGGAESHPYAMGLYKKIGVCGGRSIYQHTNNTDIFLYHGCGRWFVGLEIGVCGGWIFAESLSICVHGIHETPWTMTTEHGLLEDRVLTVTQTCSDDSVPMPQTNDRMFGPFQDYIDRTQYVVEGKEALNQEYLEDTGADINSYDTGPELYDTLKLLY